MGETRSSENTHQQTVAEVLRTATSRLVAVSASPRLDADILLRHVLSLDRTQLFARLHERLALESRSTFEKLVEARAAGSPVAYLVGEREFMGLSFKVSPSVLIPRPETEQLVEWAIEWLADRPDAAVVDIGTGSGAIVLSLAKLAGDRWIGPATGVDISKAALEVAATNRTRLGLDARVDLIEGDLLDRITRRVDLILANLPYLTPEQIEENSELRSEPRLALDGGSDGLALVRRLIDNAPPILAPDGAIALELDPSHAEKAAKHATLQFPNAVIRTQVDLSGRERFVIVERNNI